jgi:type III pantothenate kinase
MLPDHAENHMHEANHPPVLAIQVGNTRIKLAAFRGEDPDEVVFIAKDDLAGATEAAMRLYESIGAEVGSSVVVASVNKPVSDALVGALRDQLSCDIYTVPDDMPAPIGTCLDAGARPGVDRLLNAAAAYAKLKQACIVIDAGTCVTIDFVDGEGVFHGGAIAPGLRMQLQAMHAHTAALPAIDFAVPEGLAWGPNTREAMLRGVYHGVRGLAWRLIEKYAEQYGGFPLVVATGGDAAALFSDDELVNQIVPDLVLRGVALAAKSALEPDEEGAFEERPAAERTGTAGFSLLPQQVEPKQARRGTAELGDGGDGHGHGHDHGGDHGTGCGDDCGCGHD